VSLTPGYGFVKSTLVVGWKLQTFDCYLQSDVVMVWRQPNYAPPVLLSLLRKRLRKAQELIVGSNT